MAKLQMENKKEDYVYFFYSTPVANGNGIETMINNYYPGVNISGIEQGLENTCYRVSDEDIEERGIDACLQDYSRRLGEDNVVYCIKMPRQSVVDKNNIEVPVPYIVKDERHNSFLSNKFVSSVNIAGKNISLEKNYLPFEINGLFSESQVSAVNKNGNRDLSNFVARRRSTQVNLNVDELTELNQYVIDPSLDSTTSRFTKETIERERNAQVTILGILEPYEQSYHVQDKLNNYQNIAPDKMRNALANYLSPSM